MSWFRSKSSLLWKELMSGESSQEAYFRGLTANPIVASKLFCGEHMNEVMICMSRERDENKCAQQLLQASVCASHVLTPELANKFTRCMEDGGAEEECYPYLEQSFTRSAEISDRVARETQLSSADRKALDKCGFSLETNSEEEMERVMDCLLPLACPAQFKKAESCVSGEGAITSVCQEPVNQLLLCVGTFMGNVDVVMTREHMGARH